MGCEGTTEKLNPGRAGIGTLVVGMERGIRR